MADDSKGAFGAGLIGGVLGSLLTAGILLVAAPQVVGTKLVREAIQKEPQILVEGQVALQQQQAAKALEPMRAALETPFGSAWAGAQSPDVTMTYFYDYACGYCRQSNPAIDRLLAEDKGLRVVFRDYPILGPDSEVAARASLAAAKAGKFRAFHDELYAAGRPNPQTIGTVAERTGITPEMAKDASFDAELRNNHVMAQQLGATGTPLFVIGDQVINAAVPYEELKSAIAIARNAKG